MSTGFLDAKPRRPATLAAVIAIHAVGIGGLMMIVPKVAERFAPPLEGYNVPLPTIPPEVVKDPAPKTKAKTALPVDRVERRVDSKPADKGPALTGDPGPLTGAGTGEGLGGGMNVIEIDPPRDPVIVAPQFTGRNPQPPYPPGMQRLNIEGAVTVRVLVGIDGRPVRVEAVKVDQDAFFTVTRDWAMKNWRFKPAMRDGEPFQEWRTMTVRFEMN
jgi:periplasmic protein TonB